MHTYLSGILLMGHAYCPVGTRWRWCGAGVVIVLYQILTKVGRLYTLPPFSLLAKFLPAATPPMAPPSLEHPASTAT
ncbi:hypothetical protein OUZ56_019828 [Daphnia magna]|uniref:Uncharacterized protein n=1 Tax=Daphnia magna TaxID=35525 RepID=A0ABQ9ZCR2_9CRUS|nr:hypothetical protein OUZ56_019828 [Daphnia magna]